MELAEWMQLDHDSEGAVQADSNAATINSAQRKLELSTRRRTQHVWLNSWHEAELGMIRGTQI